MRIFLDANVLFSAAKSNGAIREFLRNLKQYGHELVADAYVAEEARRNIAAKHPEAKEMLEAILNTTVELHGARTFPLSRHVELPEKDRPVLSAAISLACEVLVTGDSTHFGHLFGVTVDGTRVFPPRMLADEVSASN